MEHNQHCQNQHFPLICSFPITPVLSSLPNSCLITGIDIRRTGYMSSIQNAVRRIHMIHRNHYSDTFPPS